MDLELVKLYLRIDTDDDDELLNLMMDAAKEYITETVGKFDETKSRVKLLFLAVMQDFYEHRTYSLTAVERRRLSGTCQSLIMQLSLEMEEEECLSTSEN